MKSLILLVTMTTLGLGSTAPLLPTSRPRISPSTCPASGRSTVETPAGTGTPSVELKQAGETLTGTYSSQVFGEQKVTGTIKGNAITFGFTRFSGGQKVTVTYTGTADASTMKGKVTMGDLGEGTFSGKKR